MNKMLPEDIKILSFAVVDDNFHARYNAKKKIYEYRIALNNKDPFLTDLAYVYPMEFDLDLFKRFGAVVALIIPLFVSALERSEELANAMIVRGYDPKAKRTRYRKLRFSWRDIIAFLLVGSAFAAVIVLFVFDNNGSKLDLVWRLFGVRGF